MSYFKPVYKKTLVNETALFQTSGFTWMSGGTACCPAPCSFTAIQNNPSNNRPFSNLFVSFNLPTTTANQTNFNLDWAGTQLTALTVNNAIALAIPQNKYGELIDGRTIRLTIPTGDSTTHGLVTLYSTYVNGLNVSSDSSIYAETFGNPTAGANPTITSPSTNISFLVSDDVNVPKAGGSWATGYALNPSVPPAGYKNGGTNFSFTDSTTTKVPLDITKDTPLGVCYLDKGFIVITDPTIVSNFTYTAGTVTGRMVPGDPSEGLYTGTSSNFTNLFFTASTSASCSYYSFENTWELQVGCRAETNEFYLTENPTASAINAPETAVGSGVYDLSKSTSAAYITEVGLYDNNNRLVALAKPSQPIEKLPTSPVFLDLKFKF